MENQYPYLMSNINGSNNDDSSDSSERKDNKHFKLQSFIKFKPRTSNNEINDNNSLKGAEYKVKSLLSDYIKNFQQERKNENPEINNKNPIVNFNYRKTKKRNTFITNVKIINENSKKENLPSISKKNKNNFSTLISPTKNKNIQNKNARRKSTFDVINNKNMHNNKLLKEEKNINIKKNNKKIKNNSIKEEKNGKTLSKDNFKNSKSESNTSFLNSKNENIAPIKNNNNINNESIDKMSKKKEIFNKIFEKKGIKSRNEIFKNESYHNSMISEGSEYNIIQKSFDNKLDGKKIRTNNISNNNNRKRLSCSSDTLSLLLRKKHPILFQKYNNSPKFKNKKKYIKNLTKNNNDEKYKFISNKFLKKNSNYKSIKEKLKDSLILRPEDLETSRKKKSNSIHIKSVNKININKFEKIDLNNQEINQSQSAIQNKNTGKINITINTTNLGYINKKEISRKNNSETNNINISQFFEKYRKKMEQNRGSKNFENETEQTLKTTSKANNKNIELPKKII